MEPSRIFVRGLPPNTRSAELQHHFSKFSPVTDIKHIPHKRIAYIGYRSAEDASRAIKYYNRSFIQMSRIDVELARSIHDQRALHQRNYAANPYTSVEMTSTVLDTTATENHRKRKRKDSNSELDGSHRNTKSHPRNNDPAQEAVAVKEPGVLCTSPNRGSMLPNYPRNRDEIYIDQKENAQCEPQVPADAEGRAASGLEEAHVAPGSRPSVDASTQVLNTESGASDAAWLRSRTSRLLDLVNDDETLMSKVSDLDNREPDSQIESPAPPVSDTSNQTKGQISKENLSGETLQGNIEGFGSNYGRLFIRNLPYTATEECLREFFDSYKFGSIEEVHLPIDLRSGTGSGFAYVAYTSPEAAQRALDVLDGKSFQGRLMHIIPAARKKGVGLDEFAISKLPHKKRQQMKRKAEAASSAFNWNAMFMNADAVLSSVSDRLGVAKSDLLDASSSDAAVKQAHAETHNIQATKAYFSANGVNLGAFGESDRGDTGILVKNFSYQTKASELKELFETYGPLSRLLVPPSGTIAIVEFKNRDHARSAFSELAYRKIKDSILFLEKAPKNLFIGPSTAREEGKTAKSSSKIVHKDASSDGLVQNSTLFVRNLNFSTTTDRLREVFKPLEGFQSARVKMKPDPKNQRQLLSMGFGFLEFRTKYQAQAALTAMDGYNLDGHQLLVQASRKTLDVAEERRKEDSIKKAMGQKTKIIIKNLPFEASKKDVRSLFSPYGQLRSVRVPKKFNLSTRGFAFAEFTTAKEAQNVMDTLKDTHLLGRRLVLEFAAGDVINPEQEVAELQRKVGKQADKVALQSLTSSSRKKFNVDADLN